MGGATPEEIEPEARKQGALFKDGQVTTKAVLAEESRIIDFAREGKGTMRPLCSVPDRAGGPLGGPNGKQNQSVTIAREQQAVSTPDQLAHVRKGIGALSPEQSALVNHVLTSTDRLVLVVGDAGTGKTKSVRAAFDAIHCPVEMLAPSADASRGVLRSEGFSKADTVASFLLSPQRQMAVKNGVIWVDEAGLLPIRDLSRLTDVAKQQNARIILQGDPKQHRSVVRHGNMMNVLQEYAGLPVGRLTEIWRQKNKGYKAVVADIAAGKREKAFDQLANLGWVQKVDSNTPLVDDYLAGLKSGKSQIVIAPTHAECDEISTEIRSRLKEEGKLGDDHLVRHLVPLNWTDAEKGDLAHRSDGSEVLVFHRNSGTFRAGQAVRIADWKPEDHFKDAGHFSVYREEKLPVAAGDTIRITANGKTADGHKLNNGSIYRVKGFAKDSGIVLDNGWTVPSEFGRLTHGYVTTSHASQGKTVDAVLIAMGTESKPAISAEQFYVSVSRGRESAKVYSDMTPEELKHAIQRTDNRRSATELMKPRKKPRVYDRMKNLLAKARVRFRQLHHGITAATRGHEQHRENSHAGIER